MLGRHRLGRYKYQEPGLKIRRPIERCIMRGVTIGFTAFLTALFSASILTPVETTDATTVLSALDINNSSISLTTSSSTVDLSLTAGSDGAVRTALDTVSVTAGSTGYQLYLSASGNTNALVRSGGNSNNTNDIIPTLSNNDNLVGIDSPTTLTNNTWGFAVASKNTTSGSGSEDVVANGFGEASSYPTGDNSVATSTFASIPTKGNDVLIAKRSTPASGVPTNIYYGVKATSAKPSGLYQATITYTAIGDSNTNNLASVTPERTNKISGGEELIISTPSTTALSSIASGGLNVTVGGMTCTNPVATKNDNGTGPLTNITCTAPALATGWHEVVANITTTAGNTETYIVNPGIEYYTEDGIMAMQDFTQNMCMEMNVLDTITLIDNRDDNTYKVTRQRDGNCWMVQNLRLGNSVFGTSDTLTLNSDNSDIPSSLTDPSDSSQPYTFTITSGIFNSGSDTDDWSTVVDAKHIYTNKGTDNEVNYGNLYNWYTATAGTGTTSVVNNMSASSSICPKGWKMPQNDQYSPLILAQIPGIPRSGTNVTYTDTFQAPPLSLAPAGIYSDGYSVGGLYGGYWQNMATSDAIARIFQFYVKTGEYNFQVNTLKRRGYPIQCIMNAPTMQNFTSTICTNLETAKTLTLVDNRDRNDYKVTKQADGNCWMTQNLRLGTINNGTGIQNVTLTSSNSDITGSNKTLVVLGSGEQLSDRIQTSANPTGSWADPVDAYHVYSFAGTANATTYGNLYNWYTATAASGTTSLTNTDAPMSICPANWKLPPNSGNGSYTTLIQTQIPGIPTASSAGTAGQVYTSQFVQTPLSFVFSGYYDNSTITQGDRGYYWSRATYSTDHAYRFDFNTNGNFTLRGYFYKYLGFSVRCVFIPS